MVGRRGKKSFKKTEMFKVIKSVSVDNHKTTEKAIEQALADFLKATPWKKGGPKEPEQQNIDTDIDNGNEKVGEDDDDKIDLHQMLPQRRLPLQTHQKGC